MATDLKEFQHAGLNCLIRKIESTRREWLCGYVYVPKGHQLYGAGYGVKCAALGGKEPEMVLDVHGGITFSGPLGNDRGSWCFGFDTAHFDDDTRGYNKDEAYVEAQTRELADQLAAVATSPS